MSIAVGRIVEHASKALGISAASFLEKINSFEPPNGRREFSKTMAEDYGVNSKVRCTWQFASAVLNYLYLHQAETKNGANFEDVRQECMLVLQDDAHRIRRYGFFATDILPGSERADRLAGLYAIIRQDTGDGNVRQELLVLDTGEKSDRTLGTLITPEIVTRGVWNASTRTLTYLGCGRKADFSAPFVTLKFALPDDNLDVLGGVLAGTASIEGWPVILPLLAIKIATTTSHRTWRSFCDSPDAQLRIEFVGCGTYKRKPGELAKILDEFVLEAETRVFQARNLVASFRALGKPADSYILPRVRAFVKQNFTEERNS